MTKVPQHTLCASDEITFLSCNDVRFQHQLNSGNNTLALTGQGDNSVKQSNNHSQSFQQNNQVVSDCDIIGSGNNIDLQRPPNTVTMKLLRAK
ncbi:MAG TPA: hypothetical protein VLE21_00940 [Candidatus Nitrosocosmicus sp.]|nr:hypothetical protein [Candidatus Nitrosocosmicus sp.]